MIIFANISCAFSLKCQLSRVNIGSGNGLVPSGNKPFPANIDPDLWPHMASLGHNELI